MMTRDREKKAAKKQQLLEAARLGDYQQLELVLGQLRQLRSKKKSNPLASLRKQLAGPLDSIRDPVTGFTCLHHAALNGHSHCLRLLLESGAQANATDYKGSSPLHLAAWAGNLEAVRALLAAPPSRRHTPAGSLDLPEVSGASTSVKPQTSVCSDLDIDLCNNDNQTALSLAAQFGHRQVVAELIGRGARLEPRNGRLESALDLASAHGRLETVDLLLASSVGLQQDLLRPRATLELGGRGPATACEPADSPSPGHRRQSGGGWSLLRRRDSSAPASPLQRLTQGTLSMRQRSPQKLGSELASLSPSGPIGRRATLATATSETPTKLLAHSPLHLAVRRGHLEVAALLLQKWRANLLQVTSLGGLLHECALSSAGAKQAQELVGLLFEHIRSGSSLQIGPQERLQLLDKFMKLADCRQRSVFDLLNELNNRSAHELKRLIYELSEHTQRHLQRQLQTVGGPEKEQQQQQQQVQSGDISSFVTMKRGPANNLMATNWAPGGTQTIDRRTTRHHQSYQQQQQSYLHQQQQQQYQQQALNMAFMTRSVSSLNSSLAQQPQVWAQPVYQQQLAWQQQQQPDNELADARRRRSKSRDLGSLLLEAQQQQQQQQQFQQQEPLYDNSVAANNIWLARQHQLVRSQTDCSHLTGRLFGPAPMPATFADCSSNLEQQQQDRKTINRHYHVYDHQFYPPRLLHGHPETGATLAGRQQVAVVTPFARGDPNQLRASLRSSQSAANAPVAAVVHHNGRLSLEVTQAGGQQMDRFLARHSRKAADGDQNQNPNPNSNSRRHELLRLQQKLLADQQQQQQELIHNSLSLESHLSEPHLFESTRRAIQQDFDQMIGQELLNRSHRQIIDGSLPSGAAGLTGVSLDMDTYGERLTVSGLRLVTAGAGDDNHGDTPKDANKSAQTSPYNAATKTLANAFCQTGEEDEDEADYPREPPPKPPRLSLMNAQSGKQVDLGKLRTSSLTEPPKARPPPVPLPPLSTQLRMVAGAEAVAPSSSCSSTTSGSSRGFAVDGFGLLRVAPPPRPATGPAKPTDQDSGVCTSNSPASTSHEGSDHGCGVTLPGEPHQRTRATSGAAIVRHLARAPALEAPTSENGSHKRGSLEAPPSPNTAQLCIEEVLSMQNDAETSSCSPDLDRWLSEGHRQSFSNNTTEADYENCQALQSQLQALDDDDDDDDDSSSSCTHLYESNIDAASMLDEEEDYAESPASASASASASTSSSSSAAVASKPEHLNESKVTMTKKEVLLKVVCDRVDENNDDDDDDVFYMNPAELQKIATKRSQADAETLTDEELCAAIDKDSGYIRFTLRKRRNTSRSGVDDVGVSDTKPKEDSNHQQEASKKTKLNEVVVATEMSIDGGATLTNQNLKSTQLKQWFASNLPGLVEYSSRFLANGLDNLLFLNHDSLMNDEILSKIGISDESHRLLIKERIRSELEPVDFGRLLAGAENDVNEIIKRLDLEHLFEEENMTTTLEALRQKKKSPLALIGHQTRLETVLVHLQQVERMGEKELKRQASNLSNSSVDVSMDISQTSSSSSSSKASIKSVIVSSKESAPSRQAPPPSPPPPPIKAKEESKQRPPRPPLRPPSGGVSSQSLVCEATRRLEACQQRNELAAAKAQLKPVAAARRVNAATAAAADENSSPNKPKSPKRSFVPVKSVCWPPAEQPNQQQAAAPTEASQVKPGRPNKPTPPAKPAKLASKFSVELKTRPM